MHPLKILPTGQRSLTTKGGGQAQLGEVRGSTRGSIVTILWPTYPRAGVNGQEPNASKALFVIIKKNPRELV